MHANKRLAENVIDILAREIDTALGNEILAVGHVDEKGLVREAEVVSRGDSVSVPALSHFISQGDVIIHNHPSGILTPSRADLNIASVLGDQGIGFYIVDNTVSSIYVVAEPVPVHELEKIDSSHLSSFVSSGSPLERIIDNFEVRQSQAEMLEAVCDAFNEDQICLVEAGTGVGKSLAYLIPVFEWIRKNDERVVVSTATINLQQQIFQKDTEIVKKLMRFDPGIFLIKGRGNYLCKRRLYEALDELSLFPGEGAVNAEELIAIKSWEKESSTGDRSELSFYPSEESWAAVRSEYDLCLGLKCKFHSGCFVLRARRLAAKSKLLIVNHHLLFSDISMRLNGIGFEDPAILPPVDRIIFDEAHSIEKSASSFFSDSFSFLSLSKYLNRFLREKKKKRNGIYYVLKRRGYPVDIGRMKLIPELKRSILEGLRSLDSEILQRMGGEKSLLLVEVLSRGDEDVLVLIKGLGSDLLEFIEIWEEFLSAQDEEDEDGYLYESKVLINRLTRIAALCEAFSDYKSRKNLIFWIEQIKLKRDELFVRYITTPLEISSIMQEAVFKRYRSLLFTSATLTVEGSFLFWKSRVGLTDFTYREVKEYMFPSPYDFKNNVLLCIPENVPQPNNEGYERFLADFISEALRITGGKALVLFTSYKMLKNTLFMVREKLGNSNRDIHILVQGEDDRARLLDNFKYELNSVLFATDSFWEGIDAPGKALEMVIICRLPFKVPTEPVILARMEELERSGSNSFFSLSLPDAIIRLRQGFGRLIRSHSDRGVIVILDSRLITKNYGKFFFNSLPLTRRIISSPQDILEGITSFFEEIKKGA